nr:hypothetical protein [Tanacetum cinerariifolium]
MLNPLSDVGVESIFMTTSSQIVSLEPPTPIMTPSTIATITTSGEAPIPPPTIPSIILENLLTFNSAFRFEERLRLSETSFSEYRQTNQFADVVSAIPGILHQYMDQQMKEAVREAVQIQTDRLQDSLQRENDEFLRNIDENMKKVLKGLVKNQVKEQVSRILPRIEESVNATLEAEVLTQSSHSSRTSYAVAADLSKMELKKILIENMEGNKSIQRSGEQRNLYKALVEAYEVDKAILDTYGDSTILKRRREDDDQEGPSAGPNRGSKRQKERGEQASASTPSEKATKGAGGSTTGSQSQQQFASESAYAEEPAQTTCQIEETPLSVYETGPSAGPNRGSKRQKEGGEQASASTPSEKATKGAGGSITGSQSQQRSASESAYAEEPMQTTCQMEETPPLPRKPPSPDRAWNTALPAAQGDAQSWISDLAKQADARSSFNELLDTPIDFSNFIMHRLNVDTLTPDLLVGPTFELMRGSCSSLTELEYHLEEVYKATTDQLDWVNPEGQQYPHDLLQPLPLISDNRGRRVIPFEHFINNNLEYLRGSSRKYTTSVIKTKAADYGHIKWIEDLVPREMWIQHPIDYNKYALWGVSHWGRKRKQFYGGVAETMGSGGFGFGGKGGKVREVKDGLLKSLEVWQG